MTSPSDSGPKRKRLTPAYLLSYLLLNEDTWRCLTGIVLAVLLAPFLQRFDHTGIGRYVMFITVFVVGWAVSKNHSRWIVDRLKLLFPSR